MKTLPEKDFVRFEGLYKVLCITCKSRPAPLQKFYGIFTDI